MSTALKAAPAPVIERPERDDPDPPGRSRRRAAAAAQTLLSAAIVGLLLHMRYGYTAGTGDHLVLSALGMHWANPDLFGDDWVIANAPQPHWLFDVVTWAGTATGTLEAVYFGYWVLGLLVFGFATALLARAWAPRHTWLATIAVSAIGAVTPWWLLGTGSPMLAIALPGVLAGFLIYLAVAALVTEHHVVAAIAAIATALVHVQQGAVVGVLLLAVVLVHAARDRRIHWPLLGTAVVTFGIVAANLVARPVAGDTEEFAKVCRDLIPYHCEATSWSPQMMWGGFALVGLALLSIAHFRPGRRSLWLVLVALPAIGLTAGVLLDRFNVPTWGTLAQGLNIYRLDVVLMPMAVWGALTPVFARRATWVRWLLVALVPALAYFVLGTKMTEFAYPFDRTNGGNWLYLSLAAVVLAGFAKLPRTIVTTGILAGLTMSVIVAHSFVWRPLDLTFIPNDDLRTWGKAVQSVVPPDSTMLIPPLAIDLRLATARGVVVDCKNGAYGGDATVDYEARLTALGGIKQCIKQDPGLYNSLTALQLTAIAHRYHADYLVLEPAQQWQQPAYEQLGWTVVLKPFNKLKDTVLKAPETTPSSKHN
ncbi:hypothetical protein [Umezawaea tangerina]|uniref:4-amino-4-deoxy-L-arabinose transferase-like glycosyltransferase n=1 Tax=Umezawaea tangerina TaxID=84725 RepID=A0A2T0TJN4_9PSEU|nr:hypothetical protein [Umezawaea tangerina]PRY45835.1 hypothetical protein CLV43_10195 [Umezawaea tangerina]